MNRDDARELARSLARAVDETLKTPRTLVDPASDGQVAVMVLFEELEARGYVVVRRSLLKGYF